MHLSTTGWIIVIVFIVFVISLNLSLAFALKKKSTDSTWVEQLKKTRGVFSNPWKDEDESFSRLATKVDELKPRNSKNEK
ncbi:MAG: hypothetical protein ABFD24_11500 [Anaerolineaceae bacterium]